MATAADKRAADFRRIHGLVRLLGMNDEAYRDMLKDKYGVESSKDLPPQSRFALIRHLQAQVATNAQNFADLEDRKMNKATPAQLRAIEAMWLQVSKAETLNARRAALNNFCKRLTGVQFLKWISKADAKVLIKAIHAMGAKTPDEFNEEHKPQTNR